MQQQFTPRVLHTIVPPHILSSIAERGTLQQRNRALKSLELDQYVRAARSRSIPLLQAQLPQAAAAKAVGPERSIYDAQHAIDLPGSLIRHEGQTPITDKAGNEAYDGLGWTYNFYQQVYSRNSIDNKGLPLDASIHYDVSYNNAFWDGGQMVFGDGDGDTFNRFTIALEVIGHELTHGVTGSEANLDYNDQPGALNESISDVFGSLVKQFSLNQSADQADWLIGKGLFTDKVQGEALRSMKAPGTAYDDPVLGKDPQPATMDGYVDMTDDNGGVHVNSGIPNRAFYLAAMAIGGHAWEKTGRIWYTTLCDRALKSSANFNDFAILTVKHASALYGANSQEQQAVQKAWETVKVLQTSIGTIPTNGTDATTGTVVTTPGEADSANWPIPDDSKGNAPWQFPQDTPENLPQDLSEEPDESDAAD